MPYIKELVDILPEIILYLASGYLFISVYNFVSLKKRIKDISSVLAHSLIIGFIICNIAYAIPFTISPKIDTAGILMSSALLGFLLGKIVTSKPFFILCDKLKIADTTNEYYWDDLMPQDYSMYCRVYCKEKTYEGFVTYYQSYSNEPHVVLAAYTIKTADGTVIENKTEDKTKVIVVDTSEAEHVEIEYFEESYECKRLSLLCESYKTMFGEEPKSETKKE